METKKRSDLLLVLQLLNALIQLFDANNKASNRVKQPVEDKSGSNEKSVTLGFHDRFLVAEVFRWGASF